jgi:hypothetical protein
LTHQHVTTKRSSRHILGSRHIAVLGIAAHAQAQPSTEVKQRVRYGSLGRSVRWRCRWRLGITGNCNKQCVRSAAAVVLPCAVLCCAVLPCAVLCCPVLCCDTQSLLIPDSLISWHMCSMLFT